MSSFNRVVLMGHLTRDVEVKYLQSGTAVANITLAVNERVKRGEQWVEECSFIDCTLWARKAEAAAEYLSKGSQLLVEGKLRQETWEKDGQKHSRLKVNVDDMQFTGSAKGKGGQHSQAGVTEDEYPQAPAKTAAPPAGDDIPFAWIGLLLSLATASASFI